MSDEKNNLFTANIEKEIQEKLYNWALGYLARFETSRKKLHEKMKERYKKISTLLEEESYNQLCLKILDQLEEKKYLCDVRYGRQRLSLLIRRGKSLRLAKMDLQQNGLSYKDISRVLEDIEGEIEAQSTPISLDEYAMICLIRRKKYGPFSTKEQNINKEIAALQRQGFSYSSANRFLLLDKEELEEYFYSIHL